MKFGTSNISSMLILMSEIFYEIFITYWAQIGSKINIAQNLLTFWHIWNFKHADLDFENNFY